MTKILTFLLALFTSAAGAEFKLYPADGGDRSQFAFHPSGEGSSAWSCASESGTHDANATIVFSTGFDLRESFMPTTVPDPLPGDVDTLRVLIVARNHVGSVTMYAFVDTLGANTEHISAGRSYGTSFDSGWFAWALCPWTGEGWTREDLVDLEFGIRSGIPGPTDSAVVTQCNVTVVYTPGRLRFKRRRISVTGYPPRAGRRTPPVSLLSSRGVQ